jgi:hypothetical protein
MSEYPMRAWRRVTAELVPRRLEWMSMPGLEGSDYRQNGFASASACACESVSTD